MADHRQDYQPNHGYHVNIDPEYVAVCAERDRLAAAVERVEALLEKWETPYPPGAVLPFGIRELRAALVWEADRD